MNQYSICSALELFIHYLLLINSTWRIANLSLLNKISSNGHLDIYIYIYIYINCIITQDKVLKKKSFDLVQQN